MHSRSLPSGRDRILPAEQADSTLVMSWRSVRDAKRIAIGIRFSTKSLRPRGFALYWGVRKSHLSAKLQRSVVLRLAACLLLLSGFFIALAALIVLPALDTRIGFVAAGLAVEALGAWLLTQAHRPAFSKEPQR
jgi:hypothetical protein